MNQRWRDRLVLLFLLLAGTALRLFRLGADSLWYDETVSTLLAGSPLPELIRHTAGDIHPPLYYAALRGWLIAAGYPTGRADATGIGLEFAAGFFSLFFGVLLIALTYALARRFAHPRAALLAAGFVAFSPYHIWYGQEVRMYTLGAGLGVAATLALAAGVEGQASGVRRQASGVRWWACYAVAAAAGMYTLYYFAFLLVALNLWALIRLVRGADERSGEAANGPMGGWAKRRMGQPASHFSRVTSHFSRFTFHESRVTFHVSRFTSAVSRLLLANLAAALLYAPWIPIAFRQATDPPVPPWRTAPTLLASIAEGWHALALGQSAPAWTWPVAAAVLGVYVAGLAALIKQQSGEATNQPTAKAANRQSGEATNQPTGKAANRQSGEATNQPTGKAANRQIGEATNQPTGKSANQQIGEATNQPAGKAANRQSGEATNQPAGKSANQQSGEATNQPAGKLAQRQSGEATNQPTDKSANQQSGEAANGPVTFDVSRFTFDASRLTFHASLLPIATFGPLLLILLISLATPLYHVRYLFTYSPAFYVVLGAGVAWLWAAPRARRMLAAAIAVGWLAAAAASLQTFWFDPWYRPDDHRTAVRMLQARWRPGDVLLVNAGYVYPPLLTYWQGPIAARVRLTDPLPAPREDAALVIVMTGHGDDARAPGQRLGWGDPRSDFFAMPLADADRQIAALFQTFGRVWHYRVYDTVNDPAGRIRAWLEERGDLFEDQPFAGEANMRVQGFLPRTAAAWSADLPVARYANGVQVQFDDAPVTASAGSTLYASLTWRAVAPVSAPFGVSLRLVGEDGLTWAQPTDEKPLGPLLLPPQWPVGRPLRQSIALPIPPGTPPGAYTAALLIYDPLTGAALPPQDGARQGSVVAGGVNLRPVTVTRGEAAPRPARTRFGPLALVEASSAAAVLSPGDQAPVELLWQALAAPGEPLVVVVQLLAAGDALIANLEEQPLRGRYPTQEWAAGELVRDRHVLQLPQDVPPGRYRLIVGVYRAADRSRLKTRSGLFGESDYWMIKHLTVR